MSVSTCRHCGEEVVYGRAYDGTRRRYWRHEYGGTLCRLPVRHAEPIEEDA